MDSKSKYHYQFGAVVKITLRDGEVSQQEKEFLQHLGKRLEIPKEEYDYIMKNYLSFPLEPVVTYNKMLESMYTLVQLIDEDKNIKDHQQKAWLERMAIAVGFTPVNVKYIVDKSLKVIEKGVSLENFKDEIKNINQ